ncbi:MAG: redoxin domain-containing protein [Myxococcales bacterium]|nr:redoxin domain-containing protein [Myxococcales bacterium]
MLRVGERVPDALLDAHVVDARGTSQRLADWWGDARTLTLFVRHFGCAGCAVHVHEAAGRLPELSDLGVATFVVGCGTPAHAARFVDRMALEGIGLTVLTDPSLAAQRAAGLTRSGWGAWGVVPIVRSARLWLEGFPTHLPAGDTSQQGGTLLLDRRRSVRFFHASARLGDNASMSDVMEAALAMAGEHSLLP